MKKTHYIAKLGLLLALAVVLQFLEGLIPIPLPLGVKPGISSVVIMYILLFMGFRPALAAAVLKSCFVLVIRGATAFCMSAAGGILSVLAMAVCMLIFRRNDKSAGILAVSVAGGVFHNVGQLIAASLIAGSVWTASYLPVLIIAGIIAGAFTGSLLRIILPAVSGAESSAERSNKNEKT